MQESEYWLTRLKFFVGIVESRGQDDPMKAGRVKVRCHGTHTENKDILPTENLPWALVGQSVTSAAISGIGRSPTGIVEGTQVFGVFLDAHCQQPLILVTLGGRSAQAADASSGFNDPSGTYPLEDLLGQPDISRLADERAEEHPSTILKRTTRTQDVPVARAQAIDAEGELEGFEPDEDDTTWNEPNPRYGSKTPWEDKGREFLAEVVSGYPTNHVTETESGHVLEVDDTPGAERLHRFHRSGTFEEIQQDGTVVRKVVGDDFEIVAKDKDVVIRGECNITVAGKARIKAQSMVHEVAGDYTLVVGGNMVTKIGGSQGTEVAEDRSVRVGGDDYEKIGGDSSTVVTKNDIRSTGGNETKTIGGNRNTKIGSLVLLGEVSDTLSVAGDIWTGADGNVTDIVGAAKATTVGKTETTDIVGNRTETIGGNDIQNVEKRRVVTVLGKVVETYRGFMRTVAGSTSLYGGKIRHNFKNIGSNHKHTRVRIGVAISGAPLP